jgi:hypothetical protein
MFVPTMDPLMPMILKLVMSFVLLAATLTVTV